MVLITVFSLVCYLTARPDSISMVSVISACVVMVTVDSMAGSSSWGKTRWGSGRGRHVRPLQVGCTHHQLVKTGW